MINIRRAQWGDVPSILPLWRRFYAGTDWQQTIPYDEDKITSVLYGLTAAPHSLLYAEQDGTYIGAIGVYVEPVYWGVTLTAIELFWHVDKEYRGTSVGMRLMRAAEDAAREAGAGLIFMGSIGATPPHIVAKYAEAGYTPSQNQFTKRLTECTPAARSTKT